MTTGRKDDNKPGRKDDAGKLRYSLIPARALEAVAAVLTYGAERYGAWNWTRVENAHERYQDAAFRHQEARRKGEMHDPESGLPHLAHAVACLLFRLELDLAKDAAQSAIRNEPIQDKCSTAASTTKCVPRSNVCAKCSAT